MVSSTTVPKVTGIGVKHVAQFSNKIFPEQVIFNIAFLKILVFFRKHEFFLFARKNRIISAKKQIKKNNYHSQCY